MKNTKVDRRADIYQNSQGEKFDAAVVTEGMLLQRQINTVTAIEYMKNRGIDSAIIQRVLSGFMMRDDDKTALARHAGQASAKIGAGA